MPGKKDQLRFKLQIAAPLDEVYSTFTNGTAFCEWLCDVAQVDARRGGHLFLRWESGYFVNGEYVELIPDKKIGFSWHGAGEPGAYAGQSYFQRSAGWDGIGFISPGDRLGKRVEEDA